MSTLTFVGVRAVLVRGCFGVCNLPTDRKLCIFGFLTDFQEMICPYVKVGRGWVPEFFIWFLVFHAQVSSCASEKVPDHVFCIDLIERFALPDFALTSER